MTITVMRSSKIEPATIKLLCTLLSTSESLATSDIERLAREEVYLPLVTIAHEFWLIGALVFQLKAKQLWSALPLQLRQYLEEIDAVYQQRSTDIVDELTQCSRILNGQGIEVIVLKGAASLSNGSYKNFGSRYMADIDILVKQSDVESAYQLLLDNHYQTNEQPFTLTPYQHHHLPALISANSVSYVEVHSQPLKMALNPLLTADEVWQTSIPLLSDPHTLLRQLSPSHQFILAVAHSELADQHYRDHKLNLRQLHNVYVIVEYFNQQINWQLVARHFARLAQTEVLYSVLYRLDYLFNCQTPLTLVKDTTSQAHFNRCMARYIKHQSDVARFEPWFDIVKGYSVTTIRTLYGGSSARTLCLGYYRHLSRHLRMLFRFIIDRFDSR